MLAFFFTIYKTILTMIGPVTDVHCTVYTFLYSRTSRRPITFFFINVYGDNVGLCD
jgi:hypothetical protein